MNSIFNFNIKNSKTKKLENKGALEIKNATEASYCFGTGNANTYWSGEVSCAGKYYIRN